MRVNSAVFSLLINAVLVVVAVFAIFVGLLVSRFSSVLRFA
jgi:uncharacterized membrane protein